MTSDGISTEDWAAVQEQALEIANAINTGDEARCEVLAASLLKRLNILERKYGCLPSILATRADYVNEPKVRVQLLKRAYEIALDRGDKFNVTLTASSLAEFFTEEEPDVPLAQLWIDALADALGDHWDDGEHKGLRDLTSRLEALKKEGASGRGCT